MSTALAVRAAVAARGVDVEIEVADGEVVALLGANGAGKSTVVGLAAGTLRPGSGTIAIAGAEVAGERRWVPPHRRRISLLAQDPLLLPHLDALDNVGFGPRALRRGRAESREIARARLGEVGAVQLAARRPHELSGGQQQRVALARALAPDPQLLLLDEPLSALDVEAAAQLRQVLRHAVRDAGRTAVIATHDLLDVLAIADTAVVLEDGRVAEHGPALDVLARPRSAFAARFAGVNLVVGTRRGHEAIDADGGLVVHGLPDGPGRPGERGAATFSPRAVAVHRELPGGSPRNAVVVHVVAIEPQGELVRVRGRTAAGVQLAADITATSIAMLGLSVGERVGFVVKAAEVSIYPA